MVVHGGLRQLKAAAEKSTTVATFRELSSKFQAHVTTFLGGAATADHSPGFTGFVTHSVTLI